MRNYELTDRQWAAIKPVLPNKPRGVPRVDDRQTLNGIIWVLRSGAPWRTLPRAYGPYTTCYNRFVRWRDAGIWGRIVTAISEACGDNADTACLVQAIRSDNAGTRRRGRRGRQSQKPASPSHEAADAAAPASFPRACCS